MTLNCQWWHFLYSLCRAMSLYILIQSRPKLWILDVVTATCIWLLLVRFEKYNLPCYILAAVCLLCVRCLRKVPFAISWLISRIQPVVLARILSILIKISELIEILRSFWKKPDFSADSRGSLAPLLIPLALLSAEESRLVHVHVRSPYHESKVDNSICIHNVIKQIAGFRNRIIQSLLVPRDRRPLLVAWSWRGWDFTELRWTWQVPRHHVCRLLKVEPLLFLLLQGLHLQLWH